MNYQEFQRQLLALSPNSKSLQFIADRVKQDDYRGKHISQHNRYDFENVCDILYELKKFSKKGKIKYELLICPNSQMIWLVLKNTVHFVPSYEKNIINIPRIP